MTDTPTEGGTLDTSDAGTTPEPTEGDGTTTNPESDAGTTPEYDGTSGTDPDAPARPEPGQVEAELKEAQEAGHFGKDAAEIAGDGDAEAGTEALREEYGAPKDAEGLPGETLPDYPPGHPADPTVPPSAGSTTTGGDSE